MVATRARASGELASPVTGRGKRKPPTGRSKRKPPTAEDTAAAAAAVVAWDPSAHPPTMLLPTMKQIVDLNIDRLKARKSGLGPNCLPCTNDSCRLRVLKRWRLAYYVKTGTGVAIPPYKLQMLELERRNKLKKGKATFGKGDMPATPEGEAAAADAIAAYEKAVAEATANEEKAK